MDGRFAIIENSADDNTVILVFDTPHFVTGEKVAVIGCFGAETIHQIDTGDNLEAHFEARSVLTFDEEIFARKKPHVMLHVGTYHGEGMLTNDSMCDFSFSSDILNGKWILKKIERTSSKKGFFMSLFSHQGLTLRRTK